MMGTFPYVRGNRRRLVSNLHNASSDLLAARTHQEAYVAYAALGTALYELVKDTRERPVGQEVRA